MSIYDKNKLSTLPTTVKGEVHKQIEPINASIFECCASYIPEEYKNWALKFSTTEEMQV